LFSSSPSNFLHDLGMLDNRRSDNWDCTVLFYNIVFV
jgi:hypothetical protein